MSRFKVDSFSGNYTYNPVPLCRVDNLSDPNCVHLRIKDTETTDEYIVELHWDAKGSLDLRYWVGSDPKYKEKIPLSALAIMEGIANMGNANK